MSIRAAQGSTPVPRSWAFLPHTEVCVQKELPLRPALSSRAPFPLFLAATLCVRPPEQPARPATLQLMPQMLTASTFSGHEEQ